MQVPKGAGTPRFSALPAPPAEQMPPLLRLISQPVRIETRTFAGTASVTFRYDPARLPAGVLAADAVTVMTYLPDVGAWLPVDGTVDATRHAVTVRTRHLSDWTIAVTDPAGLQWDQELARRLKRSIGGNIADVMWGPTPAVTCDPNRLLLPAQMKDDAASGTLHLCEEVLPDGRYRIDVGNSALMPRVVKPADPTNHGFTPERGPEIEPATDTIVAAREEVLSGGTFLPPGGHVAFTFDAGALPDFGSVGDVQLEGSPALGAALAQLDLTLLDIALGDGEATNRKLLKLLAAFVRAREAADCLMTAGDEVRRAVTTNDDLVAPLFDGAKKCLALAAEALRDNVGAVTGVIKAAGVSALERVVTGGLLHLPDYMDAFRSEAGLLLGKYGQAVGHDLTLHVIPTRVATLREVQADAAAVNPSLLCLGNPGKDFLPAGAPADPQLLYCPVRGGLDLDGNGRPDQLVLWRVPLRAGESGYDSGYASERYRWGAVAYLDDGTFHLLEEPIAGWRFSEPFLNPDTETPGRLQVVHPGVAAMPNPARRGAVGLVKVSEGANTDWWALLTVTSDRRLHAVRRPDGTVYAVTANPPQGNLGCIQPGTSVTCPSQPPPSRPTPTPMPPPNMSPARLLSDLAKAACDRRGLMCQPGPLGKVSTLDPRYGLGWAYGNGFEGEVFRRSGPDVSDWTATLMIGGDVPACAQVRQASVPRNVFRDLTSADCLPPD